MPTAAVNCSRGRHQHGDADGGGQLLAQKRQPAPEQRIGAGENGAHDGPRALLRMVADRQDDGPFEGDAERRQPATVRQPVGDDGHRDAGDDAEQAQRRPQADDWQRTSPLRQRVDDAAEQDRLGQLYQGNGNTSQRHARGERALDGQQGERAHIQVVGGTAHLR
jgi:hypothetical protein